MPKQFVNFLGKQTLFQESCDRVSGNSFAPPVVITAADYRFVVAQQMKEATRKKSQIFLEPSAKNTAPAIIMASLYLRAQDPDALLLVMPSDHNISNQNLFCEMVESGQSLAEDGEIVVFGVEPDRPETGYGYIGIKAENHVNEFYEKPDIKMAEELFRAGNFFWNAGIFLARASTFVDAAKAFAPELLMQIETVIEGLKEDLDFIRIPEKEWEIITPISIDKAIMERATNLRCVPFSGAWSDLGDWLSVMKSKESDSSGNFVSGRVVHKNVSDSLILTDKDGPVVAAAGLQNLIAIASADAVLIADASQTQDVRELVEQLKEKKFPEAEEHLRDYRPWGWFDNLIIDDGYKVKRLCVYPKSSLSLQSHQHRSEHWVVTEGEAAVQIDATHFVLKSNQSTYIEHEKKHRLSNNTNQLLTVIEVQTGNYLGEDDIIRYEDDFSSLR